MYAYEIERGYPDAVNVNRDGQPLLQIHHGSDGAPFPLTDVEAIDLATQIVAMLERAQ